MKVFVAHAYTDRELADQLTASLRDAGHEVSAPGTLSSLWGSDLLSTISSAIRRSDLLVAIPATTNVNIFYELGLAAGANVPTLVVAQGSERLPADLGSAPYVQLTGNPAHDVPEIVRRVGEIGQVRHEPDTEEPSTAEGVLAAAAADPSRLERFSPMEFEELVRRFFEERGYVVATIAPGRDAGIDFLLASDPPTLVEVKRYSRQGLVSVDAVRQLQGSLAASGAARAILVSSSGFTKAAVALASETPVSLLTLEDLLGVAPSASVPGN